MKIGKLIKEIKNDFKLPVKRFYLGKIAFGCPYFYPTNFVRTILHFRKLILKTEEEKRLYKENYPYHKDDSNIFKNVPIVRRSKSFIFKIFNNWYYLEIGYPFAITNLELGWKDKFSYPRVQWTPAFHIFFFKWQFCIFWTSPDGDSSKYYEMIIWYLNYCDKDIFKAELTWPWTDYETHESTWNKQYTKW